MVMMRKTTTKMSRQKMAFRLQTKVGDMKRFCFNRMKLPVHVPYFKSHFFNETSCKHELTEHCPQVIEPGSPPRTNPNHPTVSSLVSRGPQSLVSNGCLTTPLFKCTLSAPLLYITLMDSPLSIGHVQSCHIIQLQDSPVKQSCVTRGVTIMILNRKID